MDATPITVPQESDLDLDLEAEASTAPDDPITPPKRWIRENLFSSTSNSIMTFIVAFVLMMIVRWLLTQIFNEETNWGAVATNMRLIFAYNYPAEQFVRVWFAAGMTFTAIGLSVAAWNLDLSQSYRKLGVGVLGAGIVSLMVWWLLTVGFPPIVDPVSAAPSGIRLWIAIFGVAFTAIGLAMMFMVAEPHKKRVPFIGMLGGFCLGVILFVNFFKFGHYSPGKGENGENVVDLTEGVVAASTRIPWTVLMIILFVSYLFGRAIKPLLPDSFVKAVLLTWWVAGPAFMIFLVLRDPTFDWDYVMTVDVPIAAAFAIGGGALLYFLTIPGNGELSKIVGAALITFGFFNWVAAFFGWYPMLQKVRISFLLLGLAALMSATFAGEHKARLRFAGAWFGFIVLSHWLITGINTPSTLDIAAPPFLGGLLLTISIAYYVMLASFPLGILLALARTSKMPLFRVMSTTFIEVVRGIPLITILFFFAIMLPLFLPGGMDIGDLAAIFVGYTLFSAAYMAENVRGGLQAIRKGQFEASDALGLTTVQRTIFIVLPQALRVTIPNLVGQAIATFKETSLVSIVGGFEMVRIADKAIPSQAGEFTGQNRPALLFVSLVFWVFTYSMSRASRNLEAKLGVGQGR